MHGLNKDIIFPLQIFALSNNVLYNFPEQGVVPVLYVIYAQDKADSLEKRLSVRPAHLARLQLLHDEGRLLTAGPMPAVDSNDPGAAGFTGSTVIAEFESLEAAQAWADADYQGLFHPSLQQIFLVVHETVHGGLNAFSDGDRAHIMDAGIFFLFCFQFPNITELGFRQERAE